MRLAEIAKIRTHDLMELRNPSLTPGEENDTTTPEWVESILRMKTVVVRRRGFSSAHGIPVGVRGPERRHRWAAFTPAGNIHRVLTPQSILNAWRHKGFPGEMNAFAALRALQQRWDSIAYEWGPGGSVAFELATGIATVTAASDLDIVLYAADPIPLAITRSLLSSTSDLACRIDVLIETPYCGFALAEFVAAHGSKILLRTPYGRSFGNDPWGCDPCVADSSSLDAEGAPKASAASPLRKGAAK
jgi:phosphoribosyl-dephospho-CoA transferase